MQAVVSDSFNMKGRAAVDYGASGVVVIFPSAGPFDELVAGGSVLIIRPDGWMVRTRVGEVKLCGPNAHGIFLENLTKSDVPVHSRLRWGKSIWPDDAELANAVSQAIHV